MLKSAKLRAEKYFLAPATKGERVLSEQEEAVQERAKHTARLRALRLAKEAADQKIAAIAAAAKSAAKAAKAARTRRPSAA